MKFARYLPPLPPSVASLVRQRPRASSSPDESMRPEEMIDAGQDVIDESASESAQNNVLRAYRDQLVQILNDDEVRAALTSQ